MTHGLSSLLDELIDDLHSFTKFRLGKYIHEPGPQKAFTDKTINKRLLN